MKTIDNSVMFICFGNICRSPMAEAVFKKILEEHSVLSKWLVDSAGVAPWFIGSEIDPRTVHVLRQSGYEFTRRAKQVEAKDFLVFEYMLAMDDECLFDLERMAPSESKGKLQLLGSYDPTGNLFIDDP